MPPTVWLRPILRCAIALLMVALLTPMPEAEAGLFGSRRGPSSASGRRRGGGVRSGRLVGGIDPTIPYVTAPRHTWLEDDQFDVTWNPVAGASRYTVSLWRWSYARDERDALLWQTTTADNRISYPGDPALALGRYYSIEVTTDTGVSSTADIGDARSGFQLLFEEDLDLLQRDRRRIARQDLPEPETAFYLAALYAEERLYTEAIATLTPLVEAGSTDPWIYKAMGDLHSYSGLTELALDHYQMAHRLAARAGDAEAEAIILTSLGEVTAAADRIDEAIAHFDSAQSLYQRQSAEATANQLQQRIELLEALRQSR
ncbi:MAG: tetratricopeptide repeat protein [Cyanobacteria bacterium P01_A01_bin.135]